MRFKYDSLDYFNNTENFLNVPGNDAISLRAERNMLSLDQLFKETDTESRESSLNNVSYAEGQSSGIRNETVYRTCPSRGGSGGSVNCGVLLREIRDH